MGNLAEFVFSWRICVPTPALASLASSAQNPAGLDIFHHDRAAVCELVAIS